MKHLLDKRVACLLVALPLFLMSASCAPKEPVAQVAHEIDPHAQYETALNIYLMELQLADRWNDVQHLNKSDIESKNKQTKRVSRAVQYLNACERRLSSVTASD